MNGRKKLKFPRKFYKKTMHFIFFNNNNKMAFTPRSEELEL